MTGDAASKDWLFFEEGKRVPLAKVWFDEAEPAAAAEVIRSGWLCQGPKVAEFEAEFARNMNVSHAVAVSNGSIALLVSLQALGLGPGDEVIVPNMTFISSATSAMLLGGRPVLCDINLQDYCIDVERIEGLVTDRTRVILPVHYAGQTAEMDAILDIARRRNLHVLEDAAEAHLAQYRAGAYAGTIGDIGIFSFTPTKPMTTGEGGMITTNDDALADRCRLLRNFGDAGKFAWEALGFNYRMTEVAAAVGLCQLAKLDHIVDARRRRAQRYDLAFAEEEAIVRPAVRRPKDINYQLYTIRLRLDLLDCTRDAIIDALAERGVSARLYYPCLHHQKVFAEYGPYDDGDFPNTVQFAESALSLPIYTGMSDEDTEYVIAATLDAVRSHKK